MYNLSEHNRQHLMTRPTECFDQGLSIQDKIELAQNLYLLWKDALRKQSHINNLLADLERCIRLSRESMLEFRIVERSVSVVTKKRGEVAVEPGWRTSLTPFFYW